MNIKKALLPIVLVGTLLPSMHSFSQKFTVYGQGALSCGAWLEARKEGGIDESVHNVWIAGYITGVTASGDFSLKDSDVDGRANWIDNYCEENPLDYIYDAATALVLELGTPDQ